LFVVFNEDGFKIRGIGVACIQNADSILIKKLDSFETLVEFLGLEKADEADLVVFCLDLTVALLGCLAELALHSIFERDVPAVLVEIH